jgi:hypothetical protein
MLLLADIFLSIFHIALIGFNLFGWIPKCTRTFHRFSLSLTLFCWLVAGWWVGHIGYCPLTDWHWRIKYLRGEDNLPASFITYCLNQLGFSPDPFHVNMAVGILFTGIAFITIKIWVQEKISIKNNITDIL